MSYKLGLLLSFPFLISVMLFCGDLSIVEAIHSQLDSLAHTVAIKVSQNGTLTNSIIEYVSQTAGASITCSEGCSGKIGDVITFTIAKAYNPIVISSSPMQITVTRSTVIGYYAQ